MNVYWSAVRGHLEWPNSSMEPGAVSIDLSLTNENTLHLTFCFGVHNPRISASVLLVALHHSGNREVCRTGPSGPSAPAHPRALRPWRPSHPRRPVCRGIAQTRTPGFLSCSGLEGCRRPLPGHTSRKHVWEFRATFGRWGCLLWGKSCRRRPAEAYRNSWRFTYEAWQPSSKQFLSWRRHNLSISKSPHADEGVFYLESLLLMGYLMLYNHEINNCFQHRESAMFPTTLIQRGEFLLLLKKLGAPWNLSYRIGAILWK